MKVIICTWNQRMGASNFELVFISSTWDCTTFHNFLPMFKKKIQKLAGLWLAGEVVNHVGIYGSKAAEGLSAFQRRSCQLLSRHLSDNNQYWQWPIVIVWKITWKSNGMLLRFYCIVTCKCIFDDEYYSYPWKILKLDFKNIGILRLATTYIVWWFDLFSVSSIWISIIIGV